MSIGLAALIAWLFTASIGGYMLRTWVARGGLRRIIARVGWSLIWYHRVGLGLDSQDTSKAGKQDDMFDFFHSGMLLVMVAAYNYFKLFGWLRAFIELKRLMCGADGRIRSRHYCC